MSISGPSLFCCMELVIVRCETKTLPFGILNICLEIIIKKKNNFDKPAME